MALRKIPAIGYPITLTDLWAGASGAFDGRGLAAFGHGIKALSGARDVFFTNSGIASFYLILQALKKNSPLQRDEVLLPAYTAPSLVVAVKKAGLKPALCDISLGDFNADKPDLLKRVSEKTLCVVCVHMFGIPFEGVLGLREAVAKDIFVVEDCAQAFGSKIGTRMVGASSDAAFYSFNRGKNLPTYDGGCIAVSSEALSSAFEKEAASLAAPSLFRQLSCAVKCAALFLAFRPFFYGLFYPLITHFKDNEVPSDFELMSYTFFQAAFGRSLLKSCEAAFDRRRENGLALAGALKSTEGVATPAIAQGVDPVFCRFPVLIKDKTKVEPLLRRILAEGIECSRLYLKPLHHIFDLGYAHHEFPNAVYFAERLLTLPVHPYVEKRDIETMVGVIEGAMR